MLFDYINIKFRLIFVTLFLLVNFHAYSDDFSKLRNSAIILIKNGNVSKGIKIIEALGKKGDIKSIIVAGSLFINGKNIKRDLKKAFFWFNKGASQCDQKSINVLEKIFYKKRGSEFFDPQKIDYIIKKCSNMNVSNFQKKEDKINPKQKTTEIRKEKRVNQKIVKKVIDSKTSKLWQEIAPNYSGYKGHGSGFAITNDGYFITNYHVIKKCSNVAIRYNQLLGAANIVNYHYDLDIAVLKVNAPTPYFARFDVRDYQVGEKLFAAGFPISKLFGREMSFSEGMLTNTESSKNKIRKEGMLLISIPIASGNSGGPIFNKYGGIRGLAVAGWYASDIEAQAKKDKSFVGNVTFNLMVSGNLTKKWLNKINISSHNIVNKNRKFDSDEIGSIANKIIGKVECYK